MRPDLDDAEIRRYLLGLLPESEAEALEQDYFARPEALEYVRAVEDDLLDDYAAGRLGPAEKGPFESRYLTSGPLRERVLAARALRMAGLEASRPATVHSLASRWPRWRGAVAIAAGILLAIVAFWRWPWRTPQVSPAPPSIARSETPAPETSNASMPPPATAHPGVAPDRTPATTRLVFALSPVLLRGEGGPQELRVPKETTHVVLELEGDPGLLPPAGTPLTVVVATVEGRRVWRRAARRADDPARPSLLASVQLPAEALAAGDYLITLSAPAGETVSRYFVRIPRR